MTKQKGPRIKYLFGIINKDAKEYSKFSLIVVIILAISTILSYIFLRDSNNTILKFLWYFFLFNLVGTTIEMYYFLFKQKKELEAQLKEQIKQISDSINYAKRIQQAILPLDEVFKNYLPNSFILFKPKDVVSGDFYWTYRTKDIVIWTAADCTGHGVPGAFMSMIGNSLLNEIIVDKGITEADIILNELRKAIIKTLGQKGKEGEARDGMDMALCVWHKKTNKLEFSGAYNPLYLVRKNISNTNTTNAKNIKYYGENLAEFKANKQPIGYVEGKEGAFTKHEIQLQKGDTLYTFSDGYQDQYGGEKNKKFMVKRFKDLLVLIQEKSMQEQKEVLDSTIEKWKGDTEQIDDICVIGVRI